MNRHVQLRALLLFAAYRPPGTTAKTMSWSDEGVAGWKAETYQLEGKVHTLELPHVSSVDL